MQRNQAMQLGVAVVAITRRLPRLHLLGDGGRPEFYDTQQSELGRQLPAPRHIARCKYDAAHVRQATQQREIARRPVRLFECTIEIAEVDRAAAQYSFAKQQEEYRLEIGAGLRQQL